MPLLPPSIAGHGTRLSGYLHRSKGLFRLQAGGFHHVHARAQALVEDGRLRELVAVARAVEVAPLGGFSNAVSVPTSHASCVPRRRDAGPTAG